MAYDAKAIANYFLGLAKNEGQTLSPMKVQKLVYFAHGWYLALAGKPLIDERIEAWKFGPVIHSLYRSFKYYGNAPIQEPAFESKFIRGKIVLRPVSIDDNEDSQENGVVKSFLNNVWKSYGGLTAIQLSNLTHVPGSPWAQVWEEHANEYSVQISDEIIKQYFVAQAERNEHS